VLQKSCCKYNITLWLQAPASMLIRSALFCGITQRRVVIFYRRFGTTYQSHIQGSRSRISWPLKMGLIRCAETSVKDYHSTLRHTSEERMSQHNTLCNCICVHKNITTLVCSGRPPGQARNTQLHIYRGNSATGAGMANFLFAVNAETPRL
jgi:hypothetical protein